MRTSRRTLLAGSAALAPAIARLALPGSTAAFPHRPTWPKPVDITGASDPAMVSGGYMVWSYPSMETFLNLARCRPEVAFPIYEMGMGGDIYLNHAGWEFNDPQHPSTVTVPQNVRYVLHLADGTTIDGKAAEQMDFEGVVSAKLRWGWVILIPLLRNRNDVRSWVRSFHEFEDVSSYFHPLVEYAQIDGTHDFSAAPINVGGMRLYAPGRSFTLTLPDRIAYRLLRHDLMTGLELPTAEGIIEPEDAPIVVDHVYAGEIRNWNTPNPNVDPPR